MSEDVLNALSSRRVVMEALLTTIIPATDSLPDAVTAGVDIYILNALASHHARYLEVYVAFLDDLERFCEEKLGSKYAALNPEARAAGLSLFLSFNAKSFDIIRGHCFEAYLAHPRWRDGRGKNIWSQFGFRPVLRPTSQFVPST